MQYLSSYRLDAPYLVNEKKYSVLESVSLALKIIALLLLIMLFRRFYIAIAVWALSLVVNLFKRNLVFKYVYEIEDGILTVYKEYNLEKRAVCESLEIRTEIANVYLGEKGYKYYEKQMEIPVTVEKKDRQEFTLAVDAYFYALLNFHIKGDTDDIS